MDIQFTLSLCEEGLGEMDESWLAELIKVAADLLNDRLPEARDGSEYRNFSVWGTHKGQGTEAGDVAVLLPIQVDTNSRYFIV